jgi:hypothetical protein
MTGMFFSARSCCTTSDVWLGALSWCRNHCPYHLSHNLRVEMARQCTKPSMSKNTVSIPLSSDLTRRDLLGWGDNAMCHSNDCSSSLSRRQTPMTHHQWWSFWETLSPAYFCQTDRQRPSCDIASDAWSAASEQTSHWRVSSSNHWTKWHECAPPVLLLLQAPPVFPLSILWLGLYPTY